MINIVRRKIPGLLFPTPLFPAQLSHVFHIPNHRKYKLHSAMQDSDAKGADPHFVLTHNAIKQKNIEDWVQWNRNTPSTQPYNRPYIFSMVRTPQNPNIWLFGGIFVVQGGPYFVPKDNRSQYENDRYEYDVYLSVLGRNLIGKMEIEFQHPGGQVVRFNLENQIKKMKVVAIR